MRAHITVLSEPISVESEVFAFDVVGNECFFPGYEAFKFLVHPNPLRKDMDIKLTEYVVTEVSSGCMIGKGSTPKEAEEMALERLQEIDPVQLKVKINRFMQLVADLISIDY